MPAVVEPCEALLAKGEVSLGALPEVEAESEPYKGPHVNPYTCETLPKMSKLMMATLSDVPADEEEKQTFAAWWARKTQDTYTARKKEFDSVGFLVKLLVEKASGRTPEARKKWYDKKLVIMNQEFRGKLKRAESVCETIVKKPRSV